MQCVGVRLGDWDPLPLPKDVLDGEMDILVLTVEVWGAERLAVTDGEPELVVLALEVSVFGSVIDEQAHCVAEGLVDKHTEGLNVGVEVGEPPVDAEAVKQEVAEGVEEGEEEIDAVTVMVDEPVEGLGLEDRLL